MDQRLEAQPLWRRKEYLSAAPRPYEISRNPCGNPFETSFFEAISSPKADSEARYLEDEAVEIEGLRVWASPYTPKFCRGLEKR